MPTSWKSLRAHPKTLHISVGNIKYFSPTFTTTIIKSNKMNRKSFLQNSVVGLGSLTLPSFIQAVKETASAKSDLTPKVIKDGEGKVLDVIGDKQTLKITGKDTNNAFTLIEENNHPGVGIPMHIHENEDEVFQVLEGQVEVTVGGKTHLLNPGDIAFGPRGVPHAWKIVGDKEARVMLSVFPAGLEDMFEELSQLPEGPPDFPKVTEICGRYNIKFV